MLFRGIMQEGSNKPPLTISEQIALLEKRGLIISNKEFAEKVLSNINYYRLSAYFKSFQKEDDKFNEGTNFEYILKLHEFDRKLRHLLLIAIEIIEILIKTKIAYILAVNFGPHSHRDKGNFNPNKINKFEEWLMQCDNHISQNKPDTFVKYHFRKYGEELFIWKFVEVISFSMISKMFSNLKYEIQCIISEDFKYSTSFLENILYKLSNMRNLCAHNMRLWNRQIRPKLSLKSTKFSNLSPDRVGTLLYVLNDILEKLYYDKDFIENWQQEIKTLIDNPPEVPNFRDAISLPENWKEHPLWKRH